MTLKRVLLLVLAAVFVWWAFIRNRLPQTTVVNAPPTPNSAANTAASKTIQTASNAFQPYIAQLAGMIGNGIVSSFGSYGQGGSNGADTGSATWAEFTDYSPTDSGVRYSDGLDTSYI